MFQEACKSVRSLQEWPALTTLDLMAKYSEMWSITISLLLAETTWHGLRWHFLLLAPIFHCEKIIWLRLSKVFRVAYCLPFTEETAAECQKACQEFVDTVKEFNPSLLKKVKIHLLLHLVDCMKEFGPSSAFNTERCESFNSTMRSHNIYANRAAPSRDIAVSFATIEYLRFLCEGGMTKESDRKAGLGVVQLFNCDQVQSFINGASMKSLHPLKAIHKPRMLRKLQSKSCIFGTVKVSVDDSHTQLQSLSPSMNLNLSQYVSLADDVAVYGAVVSQLQQLVKCREFVKVCSGQEMRYARLLTCISKAERWLCLVRRFERLEYEGQPLTNNFECPLLMLTSEIEVVEPTSIVSSVSIVHECTSSCKFSEATCSRRVEREDITTSKLVHQHDFIYFIA